MHALMVVYGVFSSLRPWFDKTIEAHGRNIKMPDRDKARLLALHLLAMSHEEGAQLEEGL